MWRFKRAKRTTLLGIFFAATIAGLIIPYVTELRVSQTYFAALLLLPLLIKRRLYIAGMAVLIVGILLGFGRGSDYVRQLDTYKAYAGSEATIVGVAQNDGIYDDKAELKFVLSKLRIIEDNEAIPLVGQIDVAGYGERSVQVGDVVSVTGKLFPKRGSKIATVSFASIEVLSRDHGFVHGLRKEFNVNLASVLPEPQASFASSVVIGQNGSLPSATEDSLRRVGLSHIIVVSGYNLTILVHIIKNLLRKRSKFQILSLSYLVLGIFILSTGFSASIVRAAIVSALSLLGWYYGRKTKPLILLLFVASASALINPLYLWRDIGWWLSFLAFFGVLILAPLLQSTLFKRREPKTIELILLETFSAQLMTAPIIAFIFGKFAVIGILANLLVLPFIPLTMALVGASGFVAFVSLGVAGWIAMVANWLLSYILGIADKLSRISWAEVSLQLTKADVLLLYVTIICGCMLYYRKYRQKTGVMIK